MRRIVPAALLLAAPGAGHAAPQFVAGPIGAADASGGRSIELIALDPDDAPAAIRWPERIAASVAGSATPIALTREADAPAQATVAPGGFAKARYRLSARGGAVLAIPALQVAGIVVPETTALAAAEPPALPPPRDPVRLRNGFLASFQPYEPVYAVYGPGTDTEAKLQVSFQYQLFGQPGDTGPVLHRLRLAYTQRMLWDLRQHSSPFRDVDYIPELFYLQPEVALGHGVAFGGRAGLRHESNGRSGTASRSANMIYVQPQVALPLGEYRLELGPRLWAYVGRRSDNPDIAHYRGNAGLHLGFGRADGLWLAADGRLNPSSGKGAAEGQLSYPLTRLVSPDLNLYLFAQAFSGYGESLIDYDRHQTRARLGIGIVR